MKKLLKIILLVILFLTITFFAVFNNTNLSSQVTYGYYKELKEILIKRGYQPKLLVICTYRFKWLNYLLVKFNSAAPESWHTKGSAIDILVLDINADGKADGIDVDIAIDILDKEIIKTNGGIGTYKTDKNTLNHQMIHIDNRGFKARWNY
jgi:uncharacterized protein YcbK (DUF882 family)